MTYRHAVDEHGDWLCTDARKWPVMAWSSEDFIDSTNRFDHRTRQAVLRVESGWDISVIWGSCTYSDNYDWTFGNVRGERNDTFHEEPALVEVALRHPQREHVQGGDVLGWVCEEEFARFVDAVMLLPSDWDGDIHELNECKQAETHQGESK